MNTNDSPLKSNEFTTFLRKIKGLAYFTLYFKYSSNTFPSYEKTMNILAFRHGNEKHLRNLEAYWEAFLSGEIDPNSVKLPFDIEPPNYRKDNIKAMTTEEAKLSDLSSDIDEDSDTSEKDTNDIFSVGNVPNSSIKRMKEL
jgi:hypothetical protein